MNKDASDGDGKERKVSDMFKFEGWGDGVWRSGWVWSSRVDVLIDYVLMFKRSWGDGEYQIGRKYMFP